MADKYTLDQIYSFWEEQARVHGQSPAASWSDTSVIHMEIREILNYLEDGDRVLDIGCANGYSTVQFALRKKIDIRGIDFIPEMIQQANVRLGNLSRLLIGNVQFTVGDVMAISEPEQAYDKVVTIRVIINLGDWPNQLRALHQCIKPLKSGGIFLLSEATLQGWRKLNLFRNEWGLPDIPMPPFNQYLDEERLIEAMSDNLELLEVRNFASTYYVGTRVLKPILARLVGKDVDVADPGMEWNRWFSQAPAWGDYGTQKLFVFKKL